MQIINNFLVYMPRETIWFETTANIITYIRSNLEELNNIMHKTVMKLKNKFSYYTILQRKTVINDKPLFAEFANVSEDKKLHLILLYTGDPNEAVYLLVLYPQRLKNKNMKDVFQTLEIEKIFSGIFFVIRNKKVSFVESVVYKNFYIEILKFQFLSFTTLYNSSLYIGSA
ncbi:hypothetical protein SAMN02745150_00228 [Brevinema andersonii]|uniref:Uncharacterized protein n=1 Tax=Brevinema andersonii TaxID=34097 RepID=A0A1I1D815_BREAD|nr:hypothetical protein [Brevinema andersonii]SFB68960.1 hypothetical protein SAMN02745150_00228 [Brevinema andersonii]